MQNSNPPRWSSQTKIIVVLLLIAGGIYLLWKFSEVIAPVVIAVVLAYILTPLVSRIQQTLKIPRALATVLVYLLLFLVVGSLITGVVPILVNRVSSIELNLQDLVNQMSTLLGGTITVFDVTIDGQEIFARVMDTLQQILEPVMGHTIDILTGVVSSLIWVIFVLIISFYLVKESEKLKVWFEKLVPPVYRQDYNRLRLEISTIWGAFFRGQLYLSLIVMVILTPIFYAIGLPFALPMGIIAGLLEFIPSVGHGIWLVLASLLALIRGSTWIPLPNWAFFLILLGIHTIFTQFDLNYLIPRIIGRRVHLPPLVVILGIVAGAALAGVLGMVLAAPTISTLRVLGRYVYALLFDLDTYPQETPVVQPLPPPEFHWWRKYRGRFPRRRKE